MTEERAKRVRRLFDAVIDLPESERGAYIEAECRDDPELAARLKRLLAADSLAEQALASVIPAAAEPVADIADDIGPYRILELLGEGGMGSVYLAEQTVPVRRRVALKIIKLGMDTREVIARFESERQALALMNHPSIARILDAGATERGRPYFVMEYVPGIPIIQYCDRMQLDVDTRLALFCDVCRAVQHAHQKGVIHRDLKPSNILVMEDDGHPVPKIIDFGVAKAMHQRLSQLTLHTRFGLLIGTPAYMSPEQAEMTALDVDTRSDVYSLGAVLYELLVGATPIAALDDEPGAYADLHRIIRSVDPDTPSVRLTKLGEAAAAVAERRAVSVTTLRTRLRGELEWITTKALAKDPARRYQTALGLAEDIAHHLAGEAVTAGPRSARYRLGKFVRRNRTVIAGAVVVLVAVLAGLAVATTGLVEARRERDAALQARAEAESVTQFLADMLAAADPEAQGRDVTVRAVLEQAAAGVAEQFAASPLLEARLRGTIGETYRALGLFDEAERHLRRRLALSETHLPALHPDLLDSQHELARVLQRAARHSEAQALYERALAGREQVLGPEHELTISSRNNLAIVHHFQQRHDESIELLRRNLEIDSRKPFADNSAPYTTLHNLGVNYARLGRMDEAEAHFSEALTGRMRVFGAQHPATIISHVTLAEVFVWTGRAEDAERMLAQTVDDAAVSLGITHPRTLLVRHRHAAALARLGRRGEAIELLRSVLADRYEAIGERHEETLITEAELGRLLLDAGDAAEAGTLLQHAVAAAADVLAEDSLILARCRAYHGRYLREAGQSEYAEAQLLNAYAVIGDDMSRKSPDTRELRLQVLTQLRDLYLARQRPDEAQRYAELIASAAAP